MKRIGLFAFLFSVSACSVFGSDDHESSSSAPPTGQPPARTDEPAPVAPEMKGDATVDELTEQYGVFVTTTGTDDGDGSRTQPLATIGKALAMGKAKGKRVYVCAGSYAEAVTFEDGIPVAGGLDCTSPHEWKPSGGARSVVKAPASPAATAKAITKPTRIDHLEIVAPDATTPSGSSIGLLAIDAGGLAFVASKIVAGKGMKGDDGVNPTPLTQIGNTRGSEGTSEKLVTVPNLFLPGGVAGGTSTCSGAAGHDGGKGGNGGSPGFYQAKVANNFASWAPVDVGYGAAPGESKSGARGRNGASGPSATTWGTIDENGFTPASGLQGEDGLPGEGGKGGDGRGPLYPAQYHVGEYMWGYGGSGGGAGGCPGLAGTPGKGGGASVAVIAIRSAMSFDTSEIVSGDGGAGGKGTFGTAPSAGGLPGSPHADGTSGAPGGDGGDAGWSGSGAGGPSIGIAHAGGAPKLVNSTPVVGAGGAGVDRMPRQVSAIEASPSGVAESVLKLD
jgi:hypothetical protein